MASNLTKKKTFSSTAVIRVILLLLMLFTLITSFTRLQNRHRSTPSDHDQPNKLMLEMVTDSNPNSTITCDRTHFRYDLCSISGRAILDPTEPTLYSISPINTLEKIKPYPRKYENIMGQIREVSLRTTTFGPKCEVDHNSPALVFSGGGLTGNFFHDFNEGFLSLYITLTSLSIVDRDVILVIDSMHDWWAHKYADIILAFTKHPIINLANETSAHCFTQAYVGLISHGLMTMDPKAQPGSLTLAHYHSFIRSAFHSNQMGPLKPNRPRLVWLARSGSVGRVILNQEKAIMVAKEIGFDVIMYNPTRTFPLRKAFQLIDSSHAMIGVHGAAMTHLLFLREGSVAVQVVPIGLELVARACYGQPAIDVGLEYMKYKIGYNESSLSEKYHKESHVLRDAKEMLEEKAWVQEFMDIYLKEQDVKLDLDKFRVYMKMVYKKAKRFMDTHG